MSEKELMKARAAAKARRDRDDRKQDLLRQLLEVEGVNVDAISPERAVVDSLDIANRLCTARVREDRVPDRLEVTWPRSRRRAACRSASPGPSSSGTTAGATP